MEITQKKGHAKNISEIATAKIDTNIMILKESKKNNPDKEKIKELQMKLRELDELL